ncbi:MAG: hypothetical protein HEEMFOPI_01995 [Holosporales bacterium]
MLCYKKKYGHDMKKRFSRIEKEKLLDDFDQSGIKQASFSRLNNLNPKTLSRWLADRQMERIGKEEKDFNRNRRINPILMADYP